ncbi:carboxypeptidase regulatory-like domain-containing protein, partial [Candidatus Fermentibacteria bacterium]|nr:carboxypeptidase regulatory-like domain-containing protein [Candidatus Fermentibacteria bacterium]
QTISGIQFNLPPGGNISGSVSLDDGSPAMFVTIEVYESGQDEFFASDIVMGDGTYTVNGLPPGQYAVRASPGFMFPDYANEWWDDKPSQDTADLVLVQPGQTTSGIDFVLSQGGAINGEITSDAPGAFEETIFFISAYSLDDSLREVASGLTFGIGPYTVGGLREGDYKVSLQGFPYPMIPLYYDDAHSFEDAAIVTVGMGGVDNIDFALPSRGTITGRVTAPGAADITEIVEFVIAYPEEFPPEDEDFWFLFPAPVQPDGSYTILGLPSGSYRVWVSTQFAEYGEIGFCSEYYGGTSNFEEATPVQVTEGQSTTGIDVQLDREAIVQGFVSMPDGSPAGDADVSVVLIAYDAQSGFPVGIGVSDEAPVCDDDNNTFCAGYRIRRLPARPVKIAAVPYGAQAAVGYYGGGHTFDQGGSLTLVAGQTYGSDVNITLAPGTATISGVVTREDGGDPINWVIVASYDLTGHLSGFAPSGINPTTDQAWQDGRYEIRSLYSGSTHYVRAWSFFSWFWYGMLNPDAVVVITDEWYEELPAEMPPFELGFFMPFGYYYFYGFMPYVQVPFDATQVMAPATNINFTLGFEGQGSDIPTAVPSALSLDAVNPNPCQGFVSLSLSVGTTQQVFADMLDMAGRLVGSVDLGTLVCGSHRVGIDLRAMGRPTTGLYALRVRSGAGASIQKIVLLR